MFPTILLAEDDEILRMLIVDALSMLDVVVIACTCADDALLRLEQTGFFNLLLTDIRMPGKLDGLQLASIVAERWPQIPIIVTSGNRLAGDCLPSHAFFMAKPWTLDTLLKRVSSSMTSTDPLAKLN